MCTEIKLKLTLEDLVEHTLSLQVIYLKEVFTAEYFLELIVLNL
jgi:hypothetical protein